MCNRDVLLSICRIFNSLIVSPMAVTVMAHSISFPVFLCKFVQTKNDFTIILEGV